MSIGGVGIVVPVKNEQVLLPGCLQSLRSAAADCAARVEVVVVLDGCTDGSGAVVERFAASAGASGRLSVSACEVELDSVGAARAAGMRQLLGRWDPAGIWLASTDADCVVPTHWISRQLQYAAGGAAAVLGTVRVGDWDGRSAAVRLAAEAAYDPRDGHGHIHGANMGLRGDAYLRVGGFLPLPLHEDVSLVERLRAGGEPVQQAGDIAVTTSGRRIARIEHGFAGYLNDLEGEPA